MLEYPAPAIPAGYEMAGIMSLSPSSWRILVASLRTSQQRPPIRAYTVRIVRAA
jgi:hypothetical protein